MVNGTPYQGTSRTPGQLLSLTSHLSFVSCLLKICIWFSFIYQNSPLKCLYSSGDFDFNVTLHIFAHWTYLNNNYNKPKMLIHLFLGLFPLGLCPSPLLSWYYFLGNLNSLLLICPNNPSLFYSFLSTHYYSVLNLFHNYLIPYSISTHSHTALENSHFRNLYIKFLSFPLSMLRMHKLI